jgi:hypothetical protein
MSFNIIITSYNMLMTIHTHVQGHGGLLEVHLALAAVDQALANVLNANAGDEVAHLHTALHDIRIVNWQTITRSNRHTDAAHNTKQSLQIITATMAARYVLHNQEYVPMQMSSHSTHLCRRRQVL